MKKILSCLMAVALVFSLMGVSVFAAETGTGQTVDSLGSGHVVGTQGEATPGGLDNGVSDFNNATNGSNITINFNDSTQDDIDNSGDGVSTIENRYAIDITYANLVIDLTDIPNEQTITVNEVPTTATVTYVWNVNDHKYEAQYTYAGQNPSDTVVPVANSEPITIKNAFMVTNHSDLPIWYSPALNVDGTKVKNMTMYYTWDTNELTVPKEFQIKKATAAILDNAGIVVTEGSATDGNYHNIVARPETDWVITINNMTAAVTNGDVIASLVITFNPTGDANATDYTVTP